MVPVKFVAAVKLHPISSNQQASLTRGGDHTRCGVPSDLVVLIVVHTFDDVYFTSLGNGSSDNQQESVIPTQGHAPPPTVLVA